MHTQHLAHQSSTSARFEALESQAVMFPYNAYQFDLDSSILRRGCTQATDTSSVGQTRRINRHLPVNRDRRYLCRTVSKAFWPSACLSLWQHVAPSRKKKNLSSLNRSRFRSNPSTPVNTSNPIGIQSGRVIVSVLTTASHTSDPERAPC